MGHLKTPVPSLHYLSTGNRAKQEQVTQWVFREGRMKGSASVTQHNERPV